MNCGAAVVRASQFFNVIFIVEREKIDLDAHITERDFVARWRTHLDLAIKIRRPHSPPGRDRCSFQFGKSVADDRPSRPPQPIARTRLLLHRMPADAPKHGVGFAGSYRSFYDINLVV